MNLTNQYTNWDKRRGPYYLSLNHIKIPKRFTYPVKPWISNLIVDIGTNLSSFTETIQSDPKRFLRESEHRCIALYIIVKRSIARNEGNISQLSHVRIKHCFWESNKCIDVLARLGPISKLMVLFIYYYLVSSLPMDIVDFLNDNTCT